MTIYLKTFKLKRKDNLFETFKRKEKTIYGQRFVMPRRHDHMGFSQAKWLILIRINNQRNTLNVILLTKTPHLLTETLEISITSKWT